ncbi:class I SAM-dependent methyltransferase, partial [Arthrospira platensis SPKY1]|nr:class I SAM-dependent methyltransferase [Arthrospira platensis SPKY1]
VGAIRAFCRNIEQMNASQKIFPRLFHWCNVAIHRLRKNSLLKSSENIQRHYDLGNDFFSLFLDKTLMYSSAVFASPDDSLENAQLNKIDAIIKKARITSSDH